jgi:hypothetical protein
MRARMMKTLTAGLLSAALVLTATACGDDPGEDEFGDGEINDSGD